MSRFEIERLRNNAVFEELAAPVSLETVIKDAEFFIRYDCQVPLIYSLRNTQKTFWTLP